MSPSLAAMIKKLVAAAAIVAAGVANVGTAWAQAPDGAACATNTDCNSGICSRATGLCTRRGATRKPEGAACETNTDCDSGFCNAATGLCTRGGEAGRPDGASCGA